MAPVPSLCENLVQASLCRTARYDLLPWISDGCCRIPSCRAIARRDCFACTCGKCTHWKPGVSVHLGRDVGKSRDNALVSVVTSLLVTFDAACAGSSLSGGLHCNLWEVWPDDFLHTVTCSATVKKSPLLLSCKHLHVLGRYCCLSMTYWSQLVRSLLKCRCFGFNDSVFLLSPLLCGQWSVH